MPQTTHFHPRLEALNETKIWKNWSGYLVAPQYQYSEISEYYAIRNSAALLDTSPLFKYRISGPDAEPLLQVALARDIRKCRSGRAQYTAWCDEQGFVVQDGVVLRVAQDEYWLTAAEPALRYFRQLAGKLNLANLEIEDISSRFGILALQGPHSFDVLRQLTPVVDELKYFRLTQARIAQRTVLISRTGYTGDLGYELWIEADDALAIWDALMAAGRDFNLTPMGTTALKMARLEAGLLLMDVDFHSSRFAWVDAQRETPIELGWDWMFRDLENDDRQFVGRRVVQRQLENQGNRQQKARWTTVGLGIDWHDYERIFLEAGILPPKQGVYSEGTKSIYRRKDTAGDYAGYASSFLYSSLLKRPIAIAKLPLELATPGTEVDLELTVIRRPRNVMARVEELPFFCPARKTTNPCRSKS